MCGWVNVENIYYMGSSIPYTTYYVICYDLHSISMIDLHKIEI